MGEEKLTKREYVLIIPFVSTDVLLVEKKRPEWQAGKYNGPGGKVEENETPIRAAVRELYEETGCDVSEDYMEPFCVLTGLEDSVPYICYCYTCRVVESQIQQKTDEPTRLGNYSLLSPTTIVTSLRWMIPMAREKLLNFGRDAKADILVVHEVYEGDARDSKEVSLVARSR